MPSGVGTLKPVAWRRMVPLAVRISATSISLDGSSGKTALCGSLIKHETSTILSSNTLSRGLRFVATVVYAVWKVSHMRDFSGIWIVYRLFV